MERAAEREGISGNIKFLNGASDENSWMYKIMRFFKMSPTTVIFDRFIFMSEIQTI